MSIKWHPDKNNSQDAVFMMQEINEAYAILKDKIKKSRYDKEYLIFYRQKDCKYSEHWDNVYKKKWEQDY